MDIQKTFDLILESEAKKRSETQMTLKELILYLEQLHENEIVHGIGSKCDSYRGYYSDLAFVPYDKTSAGELLKCAKNALGETFYGYKGGEFIMNKNTPVWIAEYGTCGKKLIEIIPNTIGEYSLVTEEDD